VAGDQATEIKRCSEARKQRETKVANGGEMAIRIPEGPTGEGIRRTPGAIERRMEI
jgi:hypothetical protein